MSTDSSTTATTTYRNSNAMTSVSTSSKAASDDDTRKNFVVRDARKEDLQAMLNLVIELAIYEKEPKQVTATLADYEANFGQCFQAIVCEDTSSGAVVGTAIFFLIWSTWKGRMMYLEDFVVQEKYRRHGIGQLLFDEVLRKSKEQNCQLLKWAVLDWNEPAIKFYAKNNAVFEKDWWFAKIKNLQNDPNYD